MSYANLELYFPEINSITSCWENHKGWSKKSMKFKGVGMSEIQSKNVENFS